MASSYHTKSIISYMEPLQHQIYIFGINIDLRIIPSYVSDVSCSSCDTQQNDISNAIPAKRWVRRFCRISDINIMKHSSKDEFTGAKIEGYVRFTLQRDKEIK